MNRREYVTAHQYRYTVLFEPAEEGGYVVTCPSLPGLVTEGDTLQEAHANAAEAIRGYLETLAKDGLPIPHMEQALRLCVAGARWVQLRMKNAERATWLETPHSPGHRKCPCPTVGSGTQRVL